MRLKSIVVAALTLPVVCGAQHALAAGAWTESTSGDLSSDRFNPTVINPGMGTYSINATTSAGDWEYFTINIPEGAVLWALNHVSWTSQDPMGFISLQNGTTFTEPSNIPNPSNMLGWTHFGTGMGTVGHDLLPLLGQGFSAIGFTPPLPSGSYAFWIQQTSSRPATYQLDFVVIPSPSAAAAAVIPGVLVLGRRRRA